MPIGIGNANLDPQSSHLRPHVQQVLYPLASSDTYFVNAFSVSAATVGTACTIATAAASSRPVLPARRLTFTVHDASGSNLSVTVRITGKRFGRTVTKDVTSTGAASDTPVDTGVVLDEVNSCKIIAIANNTTSDTVSLGFGGHWIGLECPIDTVRAVKHVQKRDLSTPSAPVISSPVAPATIQTSTNVDVKNAAVDMNALFSAVIAVTDVYEIVFHPASNDFFLPAGWRA